MRRSYRRSGLTMGVAVLSSLVFAGTAAAHHGASPPPGDTGCGQVVTADLKLTHDVGPCTDNGLVAGADNITIDLDGYTVFGPTQSTSGAGPCALNPQPYSVSLGAGVLIEGRSSVTVKGSASARGTIKCFSGGVEMRAKKDPVTPVTSNLVTGIDVKANVGNPLSDWGEGIGIWGDAGTCDNNTVKNTLVEGNGPFGGIALYDGANCNTIGGPLAADRNTVKDNNAPVAGGSTNQDDGIRLEPSVTDNTVENNLVSGSSLDGISLFFGANRNAVKANVVQDNGDISAGGKYPRFTHRKGNGINLFAGANSNILTGNQVTGSYAHGIFVGGDSNTIDASTTSGNNVFGGSSTDLNDPKVDCGLNLWGNVTANTGSRNRTPTTAEPYCIK